MTGKRLKPGFTTGAAAAAATKAALTLLFSGEIQKNVEIRFLTDKRCIIPIDKSRVVSPFVAESFVTKDAGDDPDVTHRAEIGARVSITGGLIKREMEKGKKSNFAPPPKGQGPTITITGGKGVGVVTKPGLEVEVGRPAINSGPQKMIKEAVNNVLQAFDLCDINVEVEIIVPKGEELAKKTLNSRLGIMGGISILGTTGIVRPMSHDAYIATISSGIKVASALEVKTLVFTTGRRSERFAMDLFPGFKDLAFIQTGDFFKASLEAAEAVSGIKEVIITVFFGKAVKMAMGFAHTHAAKSELTLKKLGLWAREITGDGDLAAKIVQSNTAREAFTFIHPQYPDIIIRVGENIKDSALGFCHKKLQTRVIILDFEGLVVFDSNHHGWEKGL